MAEDFPSWLGPALGPSTGPSFADSPGSAGPEPNRNWASDEQSQAPPTSTSR